MDKSNIKADKIRPIFSDDDFYTIKLNIASNKLMDEILYAKINYRGSGGMTLFVNPKNLADIKVLKDKLGNYKYKTDSEIASHMGVIKITETALMPEDKMLMVNLKDYTVGSTSGGQVTSFNQFDIDFNKETYLIETRLSGSLTVPFSAIAINLLPAVPEDDVVIPGDGEGGEGGE